MRGRPFRVCMGLMLATVVVLGVPWHIGQSSSGVSATFRDARYDGVVQQTDWSTCGPAAVATLLSYYYGLAVGEDDALRVSLAVTEALGLHPTGGISALALVRTMDAFGVETVGYQLTVEAVADYFRRGGLPVILHVTRPQDHYVVAVGMVGDYALIADPSWGRRIEQWTQFASDKNFSGVTLVPLPTEEQAQHVAGTQRQAVAGMVDTLIHLASARTGVGDR